MATNSGMETKVKERIEKELAVGKLSFLIRERGLFDMRSAVSSFFLI